MASPYNRLQISIAPDPSADGAADLARDRVRNDLRLKTAFDNIIDKYSGDFSGVGDEIDLLTGEIVVDNGHLAKMRNEQDVGRGHAGTLLRRLAATGDDDAMSTAEDEDEARRRTWDSRAEGSAYKRRKIGTASNSLQDAVGQTLHQYASPRRHAHTASSATRCSIPERTPAHPDSTRHAAQSAGPSNGVWLDRGALEDFSKSLATQIASFVSTLANPGSRPESQPPLAPPMTTPSRMPHQRAPVNAHPRISPRQPSPGMPSLWAVPEDEPRSDWEDVREEGESSTDEDPIAVAEEYQILLHEGVSSDEEDPIAGEEEERGVPEKGESSGDEDLIVAVAEDQGLREEDQSSDDDFVSSSEKNQSDDEANLGGNDAPSENTAQLGAWTDREDVTLIKAKENENMSFPAIAKSYFPGRTHNACGSRYRKLVATGRIDTLKLDLRSPTVAETESRTRKSSVLELQPRGSRLSISTKDTSHSRSPESVAQKPTSLPGNSGSSKGTGKKALPSTHEHQVTTPTVNSDSRSETMKQPSRFTADVDELLSRVNERHRLSGTASRFTADEDELIIKLKEEQRLSFPDMERVFPGRTAQQLKNRWYTAIRESRVGAKPCVHFSAQEDDLLLELGDQTIPWKQVAPSFPGRTASQVQYRYSYLRKKGNAGEPVRKFQSGPKQCSNCGKQKTCMWRHDDVGNVLCNACGSFLRRNGYARPVDGKSRNDWKASTGSPRPSPSATAPPQRRSEQSIDGVSRNCIPASSSNVQPNPSVTAIPKRDRGRSPKEPRQEQHGTALSKAKSAAPGSQPRQKKKSLKKRWDEAFEQGIVDFDPDSGSDDYYESDESDGEPDRFNRPTSAAIATVAAVGQITRPPTATAREPEERSTQPFVTVGELMRRDRDLTGSSVSTSTASESDSGVESVPTSARKSLHTNVGQASASSTAKRPRGRPWQSVDKDDELLDMEEDNSFQAGRQADFSVLQNREEPTRYPSASALNYDSTHDRTSPNTSIPVKEKLFPCPSCGKRYNHQSGVLYHRRTSSGCSLDPVVEKTYGPLQKRETANGLGPGRPSKAPITNNMITLPSSAQGHPAAATTLSSKPQPVAGTPTPILHRVLTPLDNNESKSSGAQASASCHSDPQQIARPSPAIKAERETSATPNIASTFTPQPLKVDSLSATSRSAPQPSRFSWQPSRIAQHYRPWTSSKLARSAVIDSDELEDDLVRDDSRTSWS